MRYLVYGHYTDSKYVKYTRTTKITVHKRFAAHVQEVVAGRLKCVNGPDAVCGWSFVNAVSCPPCRFSKTLIDTMVDSRCHVVGRDGRMSDFQNRY